MSPVIAIVGPTAVGKSRLGLLLAERLNGEIVSADSRQVYRYMDIGTAKPTAAERARVPHHLIDIVDPDADFSVALYQTLASRAIDGIMERGKLAIIVGGSGLYVWSLVEGWEIPRVEPDPGLRTRLEQRAAAEGPESLYRELESADREAAASIDPRNVRRVIRALEIQRNTSVSAGDSRAKKRPRFATFMVGLTADRRELYRMIDHRVDAMMEEGLVAEVEGLRRRGYGPGLPSMSSVGYREIGLCLDGVLDLPHAIQRMKFETHRFARHQYAWFRLADPRIRWYDVGQDPGPAILAAVEGAVG